MARYSREPNYVARKTMWLAWDWWNILFGMLLIPTLIIVCYIRYTDMLPWLLIFAIWYVIPISIVLVKIIIVRHKYVEFYDSYVVEKSGVFFKKIKKSVFPEVTAVHTNKNILGYGDVHIDVVGPWDIDLKDMSRPDDIREYLVNHMLNTAAIESLSNNPYIAATDGIF